MTSKAIPVVDFSDFENRFATIAEQVLDACKNIGFFHIVNYETPSISQVDRTFELSKDYFALSVDEKLACEQDTAKGKIEGYLGLYAQRLDPKIQKKGDYKESFDMETLTEGRNIKHFPKLFQENRKDLEEFSKGMHATALQVLELLAFALKLPPNEKTGANDWLSSTHEYETNGSTSVLRLLRYPSRKQGDEGEEYDQKKNVILAGQHTDYNIITLLFQTAPGLQVRASEDEWINVPVLKNSILANMGGMAEFFTNGLLKSAMHRVIDIPEQRNGKDRYSIGYFVYPESDTKITHMPSPLIPSKRPDFKEIPKGTVITTSAEYLKYRYRRSFLEKQSNHPEVDYNYI
ncbi:hypothetical protein BDA99DRAFT_489296 [Phascolomyces articulosus]|uniref:Fe2OG dioxygenase domain-containing protein n=1 Tax=Phascolomyces articulosus TaxID=60185 RepID=A0AAD5K1X1_9FUNG|nr:hypothetical protein BDA99DRAFT_489296 [Phascolomyces articulosus]